MSNRLDSWNLDSNHGEIGGLIVLCMGPFVEGHQLIAHDHPFRHVQFVESGAIRLLIGDSEIEVEAPNMVEIPSRTVHGGTVLKDNTRLRCIFIKAETAPYV